MILLPLIPCDLEGIARYMTQKYSYVAGPQLFTTFAHFWEKTFWPATIYKTLQNQGWAEKNAQLKLQERTARTRLRSQIFSRNILRKQAGRLGCGGKEPRNLLKDLPGWVCSNRHVTHTHSSYTSRLPGYPLLNECQHFLCCSVTGSPEIGGAWQEISMMGMSQVEE